MRHRRLLSTPLLLGAAIGVLMSSCAEPQPVVEPGVSLKLARQRAANLSNVNYRLRFDIPSDPDADIAAELVATFDLADASVDLQFDFRVDEPSIERVSSNGTESAYRFEHEHLVVPAAELQVGGNTIEVAFVAGPTSLNRNPDYLYTLFVPDRARTAFPLFDQPDLKATYELTLEIPESWQAMSNAPLASVERAEVRAEHRFARSERISSYLFSFVAGEFEVLTREIDGRSMTMLHRETDAGKLARNVDAIFELHAASLAWLEGYTGIDYPYAKFGFALIPTFQYGGMEHVGAIQYRARNLLLDESPSDTELLSRASLIAHETAHMWFGDLVTMRWFDDVWTKEVFANFMAAKIVNPSFPEIDHDLSFLVRHYPRAYGVDRTEGANPIRQKLLNLNEAGQMYGAIIYNKAPIMMRQLEAIVGEAAFREGMREYLSEFAFGNATWPDLIRILDATTEADLAAWSDVWVNTAGRPTMELVAHADGPAELMQRDPAGRGRVWPQRFSVLATSTADRTETTLESSGAATRMPVADGASSPRWLFNSDGFGYGRFPADLENLVEWEALAPVAQGSELINLYESVLAGGAVAAEPCFMALSGIVEVEPNQLILDLALGQLARLYHSFLTDEQRAARTMTLEETLWRTMLAQPDGSRKKILFKAFAGLASSPARVAQLRDVWAGERAIEGLSLSEDDLIDLAEVLAIRMPDRADEIVATQLARIENPDTVRRFEFIAPSLSASRQVRDAFFESLADARNRETESWVVEALENLHHPSRIAESEPYILPALELLQEIQVTGDIFFPTRWLAATLENHRTPSAARTVRRFLAERPDYNAQLRMKILQSADLLFRSASKASDSD